MNIKETAKKWGISERRVRVYCERGDIAGAEKRGRSYFIPDNAIKPSDRRRKKYRTYLSEIEKLKKALQEKRPLTEGEKERFKDEFSVVYTHDSTTIEGNTLTIRETSLVFRGLTVDGKPLKDHLEAIGHKEAFDYIVDISKSKDPLDLWTVRQIHSLVLADRPMHRGVYRQSQVAISGSSHTPPPPYLVEEKLNEWLNAYLTSTDDLLAKMAWFHINFEAVHPFIDGNGRVGRLLLNLELMKMGYPPINIKFSDRTRYYDAFDAYHTNGDLNPMAVIIGRALVESLSGLLAIYGD